jgi:hypothetical protein
MQSVSEEQLRKHVPAETNKQATLENGVFEVVRADKLNLKAIKLSMVKIMQATSRSHTKSL